MYRYYEMNLYLRIYWGDLKKNIQHRKFLSLIIIFRRPTYCHSNDINIEIYKFNTINKNKLLLTFIRNVLCGLLSTIS